MSISPRTDQLVAGLLTEPCPQRTLVLDAAALTSASELAPVIARHDGRVLLTPHHGEMAQLAGIAPEPVANAPVGLALKMAQRSNAIILLKGAPSFVALPDATVPVHTSGFVGLSPEG